MPTLFCLGIQPNCLNVHSRFESGLPQAESLISFRRVTRRNVSSSLSFRACGPLNLMKAVQHNGPFPALSPLFSGQLLIATMRLSSLWFHTLVATAPFVSETSSLTVIHFMSGNAWSYLRLVAYGFLGLSERA